MSGLLFMKGLIAMVVLLLLLMLLLALKMMFEKGVDRRIDDDFGREPDLRPDMSQMDEDL